MQTAVETKKGNILFLTQQYEIGLYIAIYEADKNFKTIGIPDQRSSKKKEKEYHMLIRNEVEKDGHKVNLDHSSEI